MRDVMCKSVQDGPVLPSEVLFLGIESSAQTFYRCVLPARTLGCDWAGVTNDFNITCGEVRGGPAAPDADDYRVVVAQYAFGPVWAQRISALKEKGVRVVYEIDDYLHGIKDVPEHIHHAYFDRSILREFERTMGMCDALIVTNKFLAERYAKFCPGPTYVCRNGIDSDRFDVHRPPREEMTVGWAGATGHVGPLIEWLNGGVAEVLRAREDVRFVGIGAIEPVEAVAQAIGDDRVRHIPFTAFEVYPSAMADADVLLAPAGRGRWHRGKSDLRWLEASALGLPCVCDHLAYPEALLRVEDAASAASKLEELLNSPDTARTIGLSEREIIESRGRTFPSAADQWREALRLEEPYRGHQLA